MSLIPSVARTELRQLSRDGRLRLLGGLVFVLAIAALAFGIAQTQRSQQKRQQARERATQQWEGQGKKNPHVAAHYGTHVFAPTTVTTAIDPGVSAYLGRSIKIEAHKRNLATHSAAQDGAGLQRMGNFSVASVLLQLVPLLIIALGYGLWTREREGGTLRQLLSTGVDRQTLFWGKIIALSIALGVLLIPAAGLCVGILWWYSGGDVTTVVRLICLAVGYGVYFVIFSLLALSASAMATTSRGALVTLVAAWGFFCLVTPRGAAEVSGALAPLPSEAQLAADVGHSLENGIDGRTQRDVAIDGMVKDMMAKKGFVNTGLLVVDTELTGIELQAEAQWEDSVYDHHIGLLNTSINQQEAVVSWFGILSPFVAMRSLSAGLSGTDYAHHRHFSDYAESWRKALVSQLNATFAKNAGAQGWDYRAGSELWKKAPKFKYEPPDVIFALNYHATSLISLLGWFVLSLGLALVSAQKVRVV